ncbi:MAG TPA: hypothetical protein VFI62_16080, partial [Burkholderiales bacterium]|nr:hypothetical protein [Burkholderiales bacterium]
MRWIAGSGRAQLFTALGLIVILLWTAVVFALDAAHRRTVREAITGGHNLARSLAEHTASSVRFIDLSLRDM